MRRGISYMMRVYPEKFHQAKRVCVGVGGGFYWCQLSPSSGKYRLYGREGADTLTRMCYLVVVTTYHGRIRFVVDRHSKYLGTFW